MPASIDRRAENPRRFLPRQFFRMAGLATCVSLLGAACQSTSPSTPSPSTSSDPTTAATAASSVAASPSARTGCKIGTSWNNYAEIDVGQSFGQGITQALEDPAVRYIEMDAKSSTTEQNAQINQAVDDGIDVLIVRAQNADLVEPAVERALSRGVRVVALDRPIMNPNVLFVGQDDARTGELEAQALLAAKPSGRFVVINGSAASTVSLLRRQGMTRAGLPDVGKSSDTLVNVGEAFTPRWDPLIAQTEMEEFLKRNGNKVDMVFVGDDYMAGGVFAALKGQGLAGKVLVVGAGGDRPGFEPCRPGPPDRRRGDGPERGGQNRRRGCARFVLQPASGRRGHLGWKACAVHRSRQHHHPRSPRPADRVRPLQPPNRSRSAIWHGLLRLQGRAARLGGRLLTLDRPPNWRPRGSRLAG